MGCRFWGLGSFWFDQLPFATSFVLEARGYKVQRSEDICMLASNRTETDFP